MSHAAATALGKVILLGEHAVVYGVPALAAGIERGAHAEADPLPEGEESRLQLGDQAMDPTGEIGRAFVALLSEGGLIPPVSVTATIDLPTRAGLGASAAIGVAIARAALGAAGRPAPDAEVIARATAWERIFHGNPSGIDTTAAALGGCFRYTRKDGARPLAPARDLHLCVGLSGVATSTREMVEGLARLRAQHTEMVDRSIAGIAALVENAALAIGAGDVIGLGKLMDLNQMLLAGLMLSIEPLETLCRTARQAGALGAKLTGKGGGGSVLALVPDPDAGRAVLAAWQEAGYQGFLTRVAASSKT